MDRELRGVGEWVMSHNQHLNIQLGGGGSPHPYDYVDKPQMIHSSAALALEYFKLEMILYAVPFFSALKQWYAVNQHTVLYIPVVLGLPNAVGRNKNLKI